MIPGQFLLLCALASAFVVVPFAAQATSLNAVQERERLLGEGYTIVIDNEMQIRLNGEPTGSVRSLVLRHAEAQVRHVLLEEKSLRLNLMGITITDDETAVYRAGADYAILSFAMEMQAHTQIHVEGTRSEDGKSYTVRLTSAGATSQASIPNEPPLSAPEIDLLRWLDGGLREGLSAQGSLYVSLTNSLVPYTVRVVAQGSFDTPIGLVEGYQVEIEMMGTVETVILDGTGQVFYRQFAQGGMVFESVPAADAPAAATGSGGLLQALSQALGGGVASTDIFQQTLVRVDQDFPQPRQVKALTARLEGLGSESMVIDDAWQQVSQPYADGGVTYRIQTPQALPPGVMLEALRAATFEPAFRERYLDSTLHVQTDHPRIRETAAEIVGQRTATGDAVNALAAWCARSIRKSYQVTVPTAVQVLESLEGDCNEHATLYAALARASGIPTKICVGLVYSEELGAFGYHAWNESLLVPTPPVWQPVDTTLNGAGPVDATHIKLLEGDISDWLRVIGVIGSLQLRVSDISS